jgi:dTMP kinase
MARPFSCQMKVRKMGGSRPELPGLFITFEGIEGSGKTTQRDRIAKLLRAEGHRVVETREPGGTPLAERIRQLLLGSPEWMTTEPVTPECEAHLVLAARRQHVEQVILPALKEGAIVLCDRFSDSTLAYQGYGRGMDVRLLQRLDHTATGGLSPQLTLLFDLPVPQGLGRRHHPDSEQNRLDRESREFHERVRRGFLRLAARSPRRIKKIDASGDRETTARRVSTLVHRLLQERLKVKRQGRR